jgi:hypothetical protein
MGVMTHVAHPEPYTRYDVYQMDANVFILVNPNVMSKRVSRSI